MFENAQFSDGGTLTGFDFDATTGAVTGSSVALPGRLGIPPQLRNQVPNLLCEIGASEERLKREDRVMKRLNTDRTEGTYRPR